MHEQWLPVDIVSDTFASLCVAVNHYFLVRVRGGRGRKAGGTRERKGTGGGGERGAGRKQPGTAWFDLDAVFGFGPED